MLLLISDANILIDMEAGKLLEKLFQLPMQFAIPDILYKEEIEPSKAGLEFLGLQIKEVSSEYVYIAANTLPAKYGHAPSFNDYLALSLALQEDCPLLTGDQNLRKVAEAEEITVMGTIWLIDNMLKHQLLTTEEALQALHLMKLYKRRLPWDQAERIIRDYKN